MNIQLLLLLLLLAGVTESERNEATSVTAECGLDRCYFPYSWAVNRTKERHAN